nr:MAG TPA: hypothetical protein [Caudoviricetes sp.]
MSLYIRVRTHIAFACYVCYSVHIRIEHISCSIVTEEKR